jgi:hypothetical protein
MRRGRGGEELGEWREDAVAEDKTLVRASATRIHAERTVNTHDSDLRKPRFESMAPPWLSSSSAEPRTAPTPLSHASRATAMPASTRRRAVSASRFGPAPPRSATIDDARRGRGIRASIVLTSGHGKWRGVRVRREEREGGCRR